MAENVHFSTGNDLWETPKAFFNALNNEFQFTLDPCCTHENAKCSKHYTIEEDGLAQDWCGETVFCNPPYSRGTKTRPGQAEWIKKCYDEARHATVVMLIPARTDTAAFHNYIYGKSEIRFVRGRLHFGDSKNAAPFPSMVVIYRNRGTEDDSE